MKENSRCSAIPLARARWILTDRDRDADRISQGLQIQLPGSSSATIAPSCIRTEEEAPGRAVAPPSVHFPPSPNAFHGELRGVVGSPDVNHRPVLQDLVGTVGNRLPLGLRGEVVYVHFVGLALGAPRAPLILKGAH